MGEAKEFESVLQTVDLLNEDDARSFLKLIYGKMENYRSGIGDSNDFIKELESMFYEIIPKNIELRAKQKEKNKNKAD